MAVTGAIQDPARPDREMALGALQPVQALPQNNCSLLLTHIHSVVCLGAGKPSFGKICSSSHLVVLRN